MTGIAALAAAAAATQKIPGTTVGTNPQVSGIKVVTPTIVTPSGMKVTSVQNRTGKLFKLFEGVFFVFYILDHFSNKPIMRTTTLIEHKIYINDPLINTL
jgi:hypothetical protein